MMVSYVWLQLAFHSVQREAEAALGSVLVIRKEFLHETQPGGIHKPREQKKLFAFCWDLELSHLEKCPRDTKYPTESLVVGALVLQERTTPDLHSRCNACSQERVFSRWGHASRPGFCLSSGGLFGFSHLFLALPALPQGQAKLRH